MCLSDEGVDPYSRGDVVSVGSKVNFCQLDTQLLLANTNQGVVTATMLSTFSDREDCWQPHL